MTQTDIANLALAKLGNTIIEDIDDTGVPQARLAKIHYEPTLREVLRCHFWGFAMTTGPLTETVQDLIDVAGTLTPALASRLIPYGTLNGKTAWSSTGAVPGITFTGTRLYWQLNPDKWILSKFTSGTTDNDNTFSSTDDTDSPADAAFSPAGNGSGTPALSLPTPPQSLGWECVWRAPADFIKLRSVLDSAGGKIEAFDLRRVDGERCILTGDYDTISLDYVQFVDEPNDYDPLFIAAFTTLLASKLARSITGSDAMEGQLRQLYEAIALPDARTSDGQDSQSNENHPLREFLSGDLMRTRGDFFGEDQD